MKLRRAANYFVKTSLSGWDGVNWIPDIAKIALLPSDRFISVHEFDTKGQYALTDIDSPGLDDYSVVKMQTTGQIFLVGLRTQDILEDPYSKFYLLKRADKAGELYSFTKLLAASGVAKGVTRTLEQTLYADIEYVTTVNSKVATESRFSEATLYLPRDLVLRTDQEIKIDGSYWDVRDIRTNSGLVTCRALRKQSV